jgi:class 3 adenylate cyclase
LAQRLEAEAWHQALQAFFACLLEEVQRYGGTLQRLLDDGVLVLFGAPVAQEDHARRAVRAALGLQQRLRRLPVDPAWPPGEACAVCMGLHTGRILLGRLGEEQRLTYTAMGDATQRAAWLAQQAAPGTILVSAATARLVHGEVRLEACAPVPLPGQTDPGPAYQVLGLGPRPSPLRTDGARPRSRFVGRELELTTLRALLTRVEGGPGQVVGIVGEPGMGKTRLFAEFRQRLGDTRVTSLEGQCVSYGQATPYGPVLDLLRHVCGLTETDSPAVITAHVQQHLQALGMVPAEAAPVLLHLLGVSDGAAQLVGRSPQEIRTQTFATLHQMLLQESQRQPLLVVVENLHWIDPTSQAYLAELVERLAGVPLLLLVTFRPGYRPPWMEKSYATQLALPRLSPEDSRCVVQAVLHPMLVPEPLMQGLLAKAAGNPLFLEELAWTVREHGDLRLPPEVPTTIQAVLTARIDRLPPEAKQMLQTAAVIGTEVPLVFLQAIAALPEETLQRGLVQLQAAEFLYARRLEPARTTPLSMCSPRRRRISRCSRIPGNSSISRSSTCWKSASPKSARPSLNCLPITPRRRASARRPFPTGNGPVCTPASVRRMWKPSTTLPKGWSCCRRCQPRRNAASKN